MTSLTPVVETLASGARASDVTENFDITTRGRRGLVLVTSVTEPADSFSTTASVLGVDPASGQTWTILDGDAITVAGVQVLEVGPGLDDAANTANAQLPGTIRVSVAHSDATSLTRSIGLQLVG
jgi:hypothetical protein